jgi:hypothetical protein
VNEPAERSSFYALAPTRDRTQYLQIVMQVH